MAPGRVSTHHPLRESLTQPARRARPIPSPGTLDWNLRRIRPNDAPVAGAKQVYRCPEKEEQGGSCPFQQNDCPSAAQARAAVVIFPGNVETRAPCPAQQATPLGAVFAAAIGQRPVYHENCDCPSEDSAAWLQEMNCPETIAQIQRDLVHFPTVDPEKIAEEIPKRFGQRQSLCHYTVKDNKVYIKTHGEHVGFRIFMDAILLSLTRKVRMPDVEFFVNLGDWPLEKKKSSPHIHPIFSWCGSTDSKDIVMPTYDLTDSVLETMGRVSLDMMSVQANTGPPWESKNSTAVWRGRDSRKERLELVKLSRKHPELIDAAFTNFFFFKHDESLYGPIVKHISFFDFFKHKYQINVDGTVAAYRLPYLLVGDSVVLKQDSIYYEHFYNELQPWRHYIPVKSNLSDLLEKLNWAKDHDEEAKKIAKTGQEFARNNLMGDDIFCYYFKLFQEYANLQVSEPQIREGMKRVEPQTEDDLFPCTCHRKKVAFNAHFGNHPSESSTCIYHAMW
ncbi:KDEL motif-containing protein 1 [Myotis davidii]|uniref:KDEL motif-containing protein 1 n=1 Tax=Myotis davidii TaxID=225400 RepID=L5MIE1_MYODS|nr:KDEL motif-containing protein 1 [Myotis davidii]